MGLQMHQHRVMDEYKELCENITKLAAFMNGQVFKGLAFVEQELLRQQMTGMTTYQTALRMRLSLWGVEHEEICGEKKGTL